MSGLTAAVCMVTNEFGNTYGTPPPRLQGAKRACLIYRVVLRLRINRVRMHACMFTRATICRNLVRKLPCVCTCQRSAPIRHARQEPPASSYSSVDPINDRSTAAVLCATPLFTMARLFAHVVLQLDFSGRVGPCTSMTEAR